MEKPEYKLVSTLDFQCRADLEKALNRLTADGWKVLAFQTAVYTSCAVNGGGLTVANHASDPLILMERC